MVPCGHTCRYMHIMCKSVAYNVHTYMGVCFTCIATVVSNSIVYGQYKVICSSLATCKCTHVGSHQLKSKSSFSIH